MITNERRFAISIQTKKVNQNRISMQQQTCFAEGDLNVFHSCLDWTRSRVLSFKSFGYETYEPAEITGFGEGFSLALKRLKASATTTSSSSKKKFTFRIEIYFNFWSRNKLKTDDLWRERRRRFSRGDDDVGSAAELWRHQLRRWRRSRLQQQHLKIIHANF